ncbi:MAG TPA: DUF456 domain-containing protein [Thermoanaerobaculia bacterium]|nr:DUF456 domain-containing protein [Thermoanaerobaculia bacterium]
MAPEASVLLWVLAVLLVLVGIAGTVLPALPGTPLVLLGLILAAWADGFQKVGWFPLALIGGLTLLSLVVDFAATSLGAKRVGASWLAVVGAAVGTIVGLFFSIPGLILGPFVGAVLGEYLARRDRNQAIRVGVGTWIGILLGTAGKLALIFMMIGVFAFFYVFF